MSELRTREQIYEQLNKEHFVIARHENTERIMHLANTLLDQLIEIQHEEGLQILIEECDYGNTTR